MMRPADPSVSEINSYDMRKEALTRGNNVSREGQCVEDERGERLKIQS